MSHLLSTLPSPSASLHCSFRSSLYSSFPFNLPHSLLISLFPLNLPRPYFPFPYLSPLPTLIFFPLLPGSPFHLPFFLFLSFSSFFFSLFPFPKKIWEFLWFNVFNLTKFHVRSRTVNCVNFKVWGATMSQCLASNIAQIWRSSSVYLCALQGLKCN